MNAPIDPAALPWSQEAEQSVLGGLLLDNDTLAEVAGVIDASSFWHAPHRAIYAAIERLVLAHQPADVITVFEAMRNAGQADDAGGLAYLNALAQSVPSASNIRGYAMIVADKALRRSILAAAARVVDLAHGADKADEALDRAQALLADVKRVKTSGEPRPIGVLFAERVEYWQAVEEGSESPGIPTGIALLDTSLLGGLRQGWVTVIAARPSVGKTSLVTQILLHVAQQGRPVLMLSQEMKASDLVDRIAAHMGHIPLDRFSTGRLERGDWSRVAEVSDRAAALPVYIDDQPALTLLDIRAKARRVQRQADGLALVVIDYLQLCSGASNAEKRHHQIEQISRGVKTLAKELNVCVLLLSQLNRASEGDEPELHHLKESGAIEEDGDVILLLHPVDKDASGAMTMLLKVAKARQGMRGRLALFFDGKTQHWRESQADVSRGAVRRGRP